MTNKDILKRIIFEQKELFKGQYIKREKLKDLIIKSNSDLIIIISGIRRCGKSVLLHQFKSLEKEHSYYLNFDDERLIDFKVEDFDKLYEVFIELFGEQKTFYFDEIQNIQGWEVFIRRLNDYKNKIYITGSNANLLSKELGTRLTGRYVQLELFPANFKEFLDYKLFKLKKDDFYKRERIVQIKTLFDEYKTKGGFFKYLETNDIDFFKTLYDNIIYKDIITKYSLSNEKGLKDIFHFLVSNISKEFSYTTLKSISNIASITTIKDYISCLENSYLLFTISIYHNSLKKQLMNPKKAYVIDVGLANSISFKFSEDKGRLLENLVFMELKRQGNEIYYHKNKFECDFLIKKGLKITKAIQVCYELNNEDKEREIRGLVEAMQTHKLKEGLILTFDDEDEIILNNKKISIKPVWKWLLDQ